MEATSYRCCCGSEQPSFVLSLITGQYVGRIPEFKLRMSVAESASSSGLVVVEETLCGYVARTQFVSFLIGGYSFGRFYRLIYRGKNGSGGTSPPASARPHADDVIDTEREERRLMSTEEGRQRYSLCNL